MEYEPYGYDDDGNPSEFHLEDGDTPWYAVAEVMHSISHWYNDSNYNIYGPPDGYTQNLQEAYNRYYAMLEQGKMTALLVSQSDYDYSYVMLTNCPTKINYYPKVRWKLNV